MLRQRSYLLDEGLKIGQEWDNKMLKVSRTRDSIWVQSADGSFQLVGLAKVDNPRVIRFVEQFANRLPREKSYKRAWLAAQAIIDVAKQAHIPTSKLPKIKADKTKAARGKVVKTTEIGTSRTRAARPKGNPRELEDQLGAMRDEMNGMFDIKGFFTGDEEKYGQAKKAYSRMWKTRFPREGVPTFRKVKVRLPKTKQVRKSSLRKPKVDTKVPHAQGGGRVEDENPFGEVISSYSREQALSDGQLVDMTKYAKEAGFKYHTVFTNALWNYVDKVAKGRNSFDLDGIMWDIFSMLKFYAKRSKTDRITFKVKVGKRNLVLVGHVGPGDTAAPVMTVGYPSDF